MVKRPLVGLFDELPPLRVIVESRFFTAKPRIVFAFLIPADPAGSVFPRFPIPHVHVTSAKIANATVSLVELVDWRTIGRLTRVCRDSWLQRTLAAQKSYCPYPLRARSLEILLEEVSRNEIQMHLANYATVRAIDRVVLDLPSPRICPAKERFLFGLADSTAIAD